MFFIAYFRRLFVSCYLFKHIIINAISGKRWAHSEIRRNKMLRPRGFEFFPTHLCCSPLRTSETPTCHLFFQTSVTSPLRASLMDSPLSSLPSSEDEQDILTYLQKSTCLDFGSAMQELPLHCISPCARCAKGLLDEECRFQSKFVFNLNPTILTT